MAGLVLSDEYCYFNSPCVYELFSSKTAYDSVRGDIRNAKVLPGCKPVGVWSLIRHGNRNPGDSVTKNMKTLYEKLVVEIKKQFEEKTNVHCIQDIENCATSGWNSTLEVATKDLTGIGYKEIFDIGKRIRQTFTDVLSFSNNSFYFRSTNEQRTITSTIAFVHGLTDESSLNLDNNIDKPWDQDDVIRPYENCTIYQKDVKTGQVLDDEIAAYYSSAELLAVRDRVQKRLNINYQITAEELYYLYEYCRFHRTWSPNLRDPWCAFFLQEDLEVLEYRDDVRHYYRNGYGSKININLGSAVLKDLFDNFDTLTSTGGEKFIAYFTHDTMIEMTICALGLYKDSKPLRGSFRDVNRLWRTSLMSSFSANIIAVLYRCNESNETHRVQFFLNEKNTNICPEDGCTWEQFVNKFQVYSNSSIEICSDNEYAFHQTNSGYIHTYFTMKLLILLSILVSFRF
ncbi:unnamed protein product, partial [Brenthis ino]